MASIKKTKGVLIRPVVTPRGSPRLAARNVSEQETTKQVTPVRETRKKNYFNQRRVQSFVGRASIFY